MLIAAMERAATTTRPNLAMLPPIRVFTVISYPEALCASAPRLGQDALSELPDRAEFDYNFRQLPHCPRGHETTNVYPVAALRQKRQGPCCQPFVTARCCPT